MAEKQYVEKQAALNAICKACDRKHPDDKENCPQKFAGCMEFYNVFELKAADVEPVRHGRWITDNDGLPICSECEEVALQRVFIKLPEKIVDLQMVKSKRCPNCGAKMDGRNNNG